MKPGSVPTWVLIGVLILPTVAHAQQSNSSRSSAAASFGVEWAGSALGATAASGAFLLTVESGACGDDFGCVIDTVAGLAFISTAGSVAGLWTATEIARTDGSLLGGLAGALIGSAVGLVAADRFGGDSDIGIAVTLGLTQGLVTAIGARVGAALR